jgi:single-strand DNA-binding protein
MTPGVAAVDLAASGLAAPLACATLVLAIGVLMRRAHRARRREYVRLEVVPYRTDSATVADLIAMYEALHKRLLRAPLTRLRTGPPSIALEAHLIAQGNAPARAALALTCDVGDQAGVRSALRTAYPNLRLRPAAFGPDPRAALVRLRKAGPFIDRLRVPDPAETRRALMDRLLSTMHATSGPAYVQLALRPAPPRMNRRARRARRLRPDPAGIAADPDGPERPRHEHEALFHADLRVGAQTSARARQIASELRAESAQNRLVVRGTRWRHGALGLYAERIARGEARPLPGRRRDVYAAAELASLWHLPSIDFVSVPFARAAIPVAPAGPAIARPGRGPGLLADALGAVTIEPELRRQNTAVPGTVAQGKTSYLTGNLTRDPELRTLPSGLGVCNLRIACSTRRKNGSTGEWGDTPNYFDVTVWGAQGESAARFLKRGRAVAVDGRLEWREWEAADGKRRQAIGIVADVVQFLGSPVAANGSAPAAAGEGDGEEPDAVLERGEGETQVAETF